MLLLRHCTVAVLLLSTVALPTARQQAAEPTPGEATFIIFIQSREMGRERVSLDRSEDGWVIRSTGAIAPPVAVTVHSFEARYDATWHPQRLDFDQTTRGESRVLATTIAGTTASTTLARDGQVETSTLQVSADSVLLPNNAFAGYEALAPRLASARAGQEFPVFVAPSAEVRARYTGATTERIRTAARSFTATRHRLAFLNAEGVLESEVWVDDRQRLLRVSLPTASLDVVREDLASVSTRIQRFEREGDEDVRIPSVGFSLAGTLSKPADAVPAARLPAVILVPGAGQTDRDEIVSGVPIYGQLAGPLAEAGFLVVRYDKRGIAQSGGRSETATIADFAEDVRAVVNVLRKRKDVDSRHIVAVGHDEGGWTALLAAQREKRIAGVVLLASPSSRGTDLVLERQREALARLSIPEAERQTKIALQQKIHEAVLTDTGWDDLPEAVRRQVDSAYFRSFLAFDPAAIVPKVRQPILALYGELDDQVPPSHGERLDAITRGRKNGGAATVVTITGVDHRMVPATTAQQGDSTVSSDTRVSQAVFEAISAWVKEAPWLRKR